MIEHQRGNSRFSWMDSAKNEERNYKDSDKCLPSPRLDMRTTEKVEALGSSWFMMITTIKSIYKNQPTIVLQ